MKRYVREQGRATVQRLLRADLAATSRLSEIEIPSALARLGREGVIPVSDRDRAIEKLREDLQTFWILEITPELGELARSRWQNACT